MAVSNWVKDVQFSLEEIHILNNQNAANNRRQRNFSIPFVNLCEARCGRTYMILCVTAHIVWHLTFLQTYEEDKKPKQLIEQIIDQQLGLVSSHTGIKALLKP